MQEIGVLPQCLTENTLNELLDWLSSKNIPINKKQLWKICMEEDGLQHESMNEENRLQKSHNSRVQHLLNLMMKNKL